MKVISIFYVRLGKSITVIIVIILIIMNIVIIYIIIIIILILLTFMILIVKTIIIIGDSFLRSKSDVSIPIRPGLTDRYSS